MTKTRHLHSGELSLRTKLWLSFVGSVAISAAISVADLRQARAQTEPGSATAFEVASLKPVRPSPPYPVIAGSTLHGTTKLTNVTLAECLKFAFRITSDDQIVGPDWIKSTEVLFDIVGKAPPETPPDKVRLMTLNLLTDRFNLKLHHEERAIAHFALALDRKGSKLRESAATADPSGTELRRGRIVLYRASMATLILALGRLGTGRPIVDMTGLKGRYDVKLEWTPLTQGVAKQGDAVEAAALPAGLTFFEALPEQLGLRLEPRKGPMDVIVIDAASRTPVAN